MTRKRPTTGSAGVLFDVDGTLVDTTFLHTVCWAEAFRQADQVLTMADIHHAIGMGSSELFDHLLGADRDSDTEAGLKAAHLTLYRQYWGRLSPVHGAVDLLRACAERGLQVVLASSASEEELSALRSALDADEAISAATSPADADAGKPSPDLLHAGLDAGGLSAEDAVFVGDSVWDAAAAVRADIRFIGMTCGGTPEGDLRDAGALEVWRDPADLLHNVDRSVLGKLSVS